MALVTGAAGGIGSAVCAHLERDGAFPVGLDLEPAERPAAGTVLRGDVGEEQDVERAIDEIEQRHGRLDIVVHCAALPQGEVVWKLAAAEWDRILRVNLRGAFLLAHHAIPLMRRGGTGGRIVLVGSVSGSAGRFGQSAYAASKAGLIGFAKSIAREIARFGILVNVVEPGLTRTAMSAALPEKVRAAAVAGTLTGRMAEPSDIASMIAYLCGPGGRQITGQVLRIDGGEYL